jgi:hypothetical protein
MPVGHSWKTLIGWACDVSRGHLRVLWRVLTSHSTKKVFGFAAVVPVLALCLFVDSALIRWSGFAAEVLLEVDAALLDGGTQWMLLACCGVCLATLVWVRRRGGERVGNLESDFRNRLQAGGEDGFELSIRESDLIWHEPGTWLLGLAGLAALRYAMNYDRAARSTQALALLGLAALGQAAAVAVSWEPHRVVKARNLESKNTNKIEVGGNKEAPEEVQKSETEGGVERRDDGTTAVQERWTRARERGPDIRGAVAGTLVVLLACVAVFCREGMPEFHYRSRARLTGLWDNPNVFGALMAMGTVLAIAMVWPSEADGEDRPNVSGGSRCLNLIAHSVFHSPRSAMKRAFWLAAAVVLATGLLRSYSRGAWFGAAVGLAYLGWQLQHHPGKRELRILFPRLKLNCLVCAAALAVVASWSLRHAGGPVAQRAASVANSNDFSWRNRVASWEGALQMMTERPFFGLGWNRPQWVYVQFYGSSSVPDRGALQLNDYLILGTALGLPVLFCFASYVGLSLCPRAKAKPLRTTQERMRQQSGDGRQKTEPPAPPALDFGHWTLDSAAVCRAGAVVLLVGFWFDGGLFKLATGATFWILLELGRADTDERA